MKKFIIILFFLSIFSCTSKDIIIEEISFLHDNSNAQPSLVSKNGSLSLTWISSNEDKKAALNFSQFKDGEWTNPQTVATGSDWFVNWADFHYISINNKSDLMPPVSVVSPAILTKYNGPTKS